MMEPESYEQMNENSLMALCIWREACGEQYLVKCCVGHVILNRAAVPCWWNDGQISIRRTILKPWQFSSFNANDPNSEKWPEEGDQSWIDSVVAQEAVIENTVADPTGGATFYHDISMGWPKAWGNEAEFENTLNLGRMRFYKMVKQMPFLDAE